MYMRIKIILLLYNKKHLKKLTLQILQHIVKNVIILAIKIVRLDQDKANLIVARWKMDNVQFAHRNVIMYII